MQSPASTAPPDFHRDLAAARIQVTDLPGGGKEFLLPASRNYREKIITTIMLAVFAGIFTFLILFARGFLSGLPWAWARFLVVNILFYPVAVMGLVSAVFIIICGDTWLRSSRVIAANHELHVETRWLFVRRLEIIPAVKIIRTRAANNTTTNDTKYFDIEIVTTGEKPGWFFKLFPPTNVKDEIQAQRIRTGGKDLRAMTNIQGEAEAGWILAQLRAALNLNV